LRARRRRRVLLLAGLLAVLVAATVALAGFHLLEVRSRLLAARAGLEEGAQALTENRPEDAGQAFAASQADVEGARSALDSISVRLVGTLPLARPNVRAVGELAAAAGAVGAAGEELAGAVGSLPDGISALAPQDGALQFEPLRALAPRLRRASELMDNARARVEAIPPTMLVGPVLDATSELQNELIGASRAVASAATLSEQLPVLLGGDGPRRYFFGAANPAEARAGGGFIGAFSILTIEGGRLSFGEFSTISTIPQVSVDLIEAPNPAYARRYNRYGGAGYMQNINLTADFPSAATAIERLWAQTSGAPVDGTILADPFALAALLRVTGPTEAPGLGLVEASTVVEQFTQEAYGTFGRDSSDKRKRALGVVSAAVLERFLSTGGDDARAASAALAESAMGGHLLVHSTDPDVQAALQTVGIAGRVAASEHDHLSVMTSNAAANKADAFMERTVAYDVQLQGDGGGVGTAEIALRNTTPSSGLDPTVIGPSGAVQAGQNIDLLDVRCGPGCMLLPPAPGTAPLSLSQDEELGLPVFTTVVDLLSGEETELNLGWTLPQAWDGDEAGGIYRLDFAGQVTMQPTALSVSVEVPTGMEVVRTNPAMEVFNGVATYEGAAPFRQTFEVEFRRPPLERIVDSTRQVLEQPLW